jgi:hypothetical protein
MPPGALQEQSQPLVMYVTLLPAASQDFFKCKSSSGDKVSREEGNGPLFVLLGRAEIL